MLNAFRTRSGSLLLACVGLLGPAGWLQGGIIKVNSSAALGANDAVLWSQFGSAPKTLPCINHFTSSNGLTGDIDDGPCGAMVHGAPQLQQNPNLLNTPSYDNQYGGPVQVFFNQPVFGVGVLMINNFGTNLPFFYHISVFHSGVSLGVFDFASAQVANTPTYVGILDSLQEITEVFITVDATPSNSGNNFALDTVNLNRSGQGPSPVPEPSALSLTGIAGVMLIGAGIRRRLRLQ